MKTGHIHTLRVEFEDVDRYDIVHHTKLIAYLERARVRVLESIGLDTGKTEIKLVMYDISMKFKRPARLGDNLDIYTDLKQEDDYRIVFIYKIKRDTVLIAKASTSIVFVCGSDNQLIPVPEKVRNYAESKGK